MQQIQIQPVPNQTVKTVVGGQNVQIALYQNGQGMFCDVNVNGIDVSVGTLALNFVPLAPANYNGMTGNLVLIDTQGTSDPDYTGLGTRWALVYLTAADYADLVPK